MAVRRLRADEVEEALALVVDAQQVPERTIAYVGTTLDGIRAELEGLDPPWLDTALAAVDDDGAIAGVACAEIDEELGRAWIHGPWVVDGDGAWDRHARPLVDAVLAGLPAGVAELELSGTVANRRLAALAASLGWGATVVNIPMTVDAGVARSWADPAGVELRAATAADAAAIAPLHAAEFPGTYATPEQVVRDHVALVADGIGYAAGKVTPDGEAYVDFVAVHPAARGQGAGRALVVALVRELLDRRPDAPTVSLTVQEPRVPARRLYERLGFAAEPGIVGYRSWVSP